MANHETNDLTLSIMTLRNTDFPTRLDATRQAGFQGMGWRLEDFTGPNEAHLSEDDLVNLAKSSGVRPVEIEFLREWVGHEDSPVYRDREAKLFSLAGRLAARHMNVGIFEPRSKEEIIRSLRTLGKRAAQAELLVQMEFMPYTPPVDTLRDACEVVREVDEPNVGLLIDAWHWGRTPGSAEALCEIPPEYVTSIQLGDHLGKPLPDIVEEARHHRCVPGAGAMDLVGFLRVLNEHGVDAPLSIEVMSDELDAMPPVEAAGKVATMTREVLQRYGAAATAPMRPSGVASGGLEHGRVEAEDGRAPTAR